MTGVEAAGGDQALRVLIVDNRSDRRELMRHVVAGTGLAGPEVIEAATAEEAKAQLEVDGNDVVVVEIQLPVDLGLETIAVLRKHAPASRIVVCSFCHDEATKARAQEEGADVYLDKPISSRSLHDVLCGLTAESRQV